MFRLPQGQEELVRNIWEMEFHVRLALNGLGVPKWRLNFLENHFAPAGSELNAPVHLHGPDGGLGGKIATRSKGVGLHHPGDAVSCAF